MNDQIFDALLDTVLGGICSSTDNEIDRLFRGQNRRLVPQLLEVVNALEEYWPMSLRQIYYPAVANLLVPNANAQYRRIGSICNTLRENDILRWRAMEDRARRTLDKRGLSGLQELLQENLRTALNWCYYHRGHRTVFLISDVIECAKSLPVGKGPEPSAATAARRRSSP